MRITRSTMLVYKEKACQDINLKKAVCYIEHRVKQSCIKNIAHTHLVIGKNVRPLTIAVFSLFCGLNCGF